MVKQDWFDAAECKKATAYASNLCKWFEGLIYNWDALVSLLKKEKPDIDVENIKKLEDHLEIVDGPGCQYQSIEIQKDALQELKSLGKPP